MENLGFSLKGSPNYAYGFDTHSVGSRQSNSAYATSGRVKANVGNTAYLEGWYSR